MPMQLSTRKGQGLRLIGLSICDSEPAMLCAYCSIYFILRIVLNIKYEVQSVVFIVNLSTSGINPWSIPGLG